MFVKRINLSCTRSARCLSYCRQLSPLTPTDIFNSLSEHVVGQEHVKLALSVGMYKHLVGMKHRQLLKKSSEKSTTAPVNDALLDRRALEGFGLHESQKEEARSKEKKQQKLESDDDNAIPSAINLRSGKVVHHQAFGKTNILIMGSTGTGKTLLAQTLANLIGVPMVITDATSLTQAGYMGDDVEMLLAKLYTQSGYDLELAQRGIVYIDEIDKISKKSTGPSMSRDVSGEGVQQSLLKLLEGAEVTIPKIGLKQRPGGDVIQINTSEILFICAGSFAGIENIIRRRLYGNEEGVSDGDEDILNIDLIKFGLIPEFIGRFPIVTSTSPLTVEELAEIIHKPKNAILKQYEYFFALHHVELIVTPDAQRAIAETAIQRGTGARGLRSILEKLLTPVMFRLPDNSQGVAASRVSGGRGDGFHCHTALVDANVVQGKSGVVLLKGDLSAEMYLAAEMQKETQESSDYSSDDRVTIVEPSTPARFM